MPPKPNPPALDPTTSELIRSKARQVVRCCHLSSSELPDVEQDLTLHVWRRLDRFDPTKTEREAFVRMLVAHATASALRGRRSRSKKAAQPLDWALRVGACDPVDPKAWPGPQQERALALDVEEILATLPHRLRRVARAVSGGSITEAARQLKMSRAAVYRRLEELRAAFVAAGFEEFCTPARTLRRRRG